MNNIASPELLYLALTAGLTGSLWLGYIVNRIGERGVLATLKTPDLDTPPQAKWAHRLMRAHSNAVENLAVFTALVLAVQFSQVNSDVTATAACLFFYARLAHAITYTMGVPVLRTLAFFAGFCCQLILLINLF